MNTKEPTIRSLKSAFRAHATTVATYLICAGELLEAAAAPPRPVPPTPEVSAVRKAEIDRTIAKRHQAAAHKAVGRSLRAQRAYEASQAQQAYLDRMAPVWAAEQRANTLTAIEASKAQAIGAMADAQQRRAAIDRQRYILESQALGQPQIFTPNGFQPYIYGTAQPITRP